MARHPTHVSPAIELAIGSIVVVAWAIGLDHFYQLSDTELVITIAAGLLGAASVALTGSLHRRLLRPEQARLDQLNDDAKRDSLTGLINRPELFRVLNESIRDARRQDMVLGVLFLDLDRFKVVNDSLGHEAGDELLRIVAERLRSTIRNTDVVARLGGDEFVVLCRDLLSADSVVAMARQIHRRFEDPVAIGGQDHRIGTSIGIAVATPQDVRQADDLIRDADAAMYRAKETKSGVAVFDEAHRLQLADRMGIERDLRLALERDEITVHYQPIIDAGSRRLYAFEALVRWNHPQRGELSPIDFLPIAEEAGLMAKVSDYVMREACAQAAVWNHASRSAQDIRMSVNLSEQQLVDASLGRRVADILAWSGLRPQQLVLEITEDVIVDHLDSLQILRDLRSLGVELSIDDFGTGQSSLGYVKQFDMVTTVKIDKRFVRDMRGGGADRAIIEAVVAIAAALDMRVVAEGVEFRDQAEDLQALGVTLMQGYLFSPPVGAAMIDPKLWFPEQPQPTGPIAHQ